MHTSTPESASARAYRHLKRGILSGEFPGGTFLTEGAIAGELEISRTPVREALLQLRAEDLVELYPKKGALVLTVTAGDVRDVYEARGLIEEWAAGKAWGRRTTFIEPLHALLDQMERCAAAEDFMAFSEGDRRFHELIVEAAGNTVISRQYQHLRDRQLTIVAAQLRIDVDRMTQALAAHRRLIEQLESGTREGFVREAREHVVDASRRATA